MNDRQEFRTTEQKVYLRQYKEEDCKEIAKLFYDTVHTVNAKDYSEEQRKVWATGQVDIKVWNESFLNNQGIGVASMLCEALEAHSFSFGSERITTHASITAKPFFFKRGYQIVKEQQVMREGVSLTNYVMVLEKDVQ